MEEDWGVINTFNSRDILYALSSFGSQGFNLSIDVCHNKPKEKMMH